MQHIIAEDILNCGYEGPRLDVNAAKMREQIIDSMNAIKYSGSNKENLSSFIIQFQTKFSTVGAPAQLATMVLASCLTGDAQEAFLNWQSKLRDTLKNTDINHIPANHLVAALAVRFWSTDIREQHVANLSLSLKQRNDEKVSVFISRFKREVEGLKIQDDKLLQMLSNAIQAHTGAPTPNRYHTFREYCTDLELWASAADNRPLTLQQPSQPSPLTRVNAVVTTSPAPEAPQKTVEDLHRLISTLHETMVQQQAMLTETTKACLSAKAPEKPVPEKALFSVPSQMPTKNIPTTLINKQFEHPRPKSIRDFSTTCAFCNKQGHATEACHRKYEKDCKDNGWEVEPFAPRTTYQRRDQYPTTGYSKQDNRTGHKFQQSTGAVAPGTQGKW